MYDVIIIGGGAAAMSAAIYSSRREMKTLVIARDIGGQMLWASTIENYPGFKSIAASELSQKMFEQAKNLGVEIKMAEAQKIVHSPDGNFEVAAGRETFAGKTIIIAIGAERRKLNIPGEKELTGRGVAYCANCDGPLFRGKTVAVVGGGNSALDAAGLLSKIATKIYLINQMKDFQAFEALQNKIKNETNIEKIFSSQIEEIKGEKKVAGIIVKNLKDNSLREIAVDGIFIEIGFAVNTDIAATLIKTNNKREIVVNEEYKTSTPGIFAAGDCTDRPFKQIVISASQGAIAALSAYQYIQMKEKK
jgi:thioredoxin-disulfide reductase